MNLTDFKELLGSLQRTGNEGENIEAKRAETDSSVWQYKSSKTL